MLGNFENGNPYVEIEVFGMVRENKKIKAMVDTGFNGYLSLPYVVAFPLGLVLKGIELSTLADGSTSHHFVCIGKVLLENKEVETTIDILPSGPILMGTGLLKKLGKYMSVDFTSERVELLDIETVEQED